MSSSVASSLSLTTSMTYLNITVQPENITSNISNVSLSFNASDLTELEENSQEVWVMPHVYFVVAVSLLSVEATLSILSNVVLIVTIWYSPSLKTPPNAQLVSICANNLGLAVSMILSIVSLCFSASDGATGFTRVLGHVQLFINATCLLQYWSIFAAIGFYRSRTLKRPSMSLRVRKRVIMRSIWIGWTLSLMLGLTLCLSFRALYCSLTWNAFRQIIVGDLDELEKLSLEQRVVMLVFLSALIVGLIVIIQSYYRIIRTLYVARPLGHNRVSPWTRASVSSEDNDLVVVARRSYRPAESNWSRVPFTISGGAVSDNFVVHYQKRQHSLSLDEVFALENPLRAHIKLGLHHHRQLQPTLSNASNTSTRSRPADFSDITPGGELHRFQCIKNSCAMQSHSLRRDRISLSSATKNSLIMIGTYLVCSLPLLVCSIPGIADGRSVQDLSLTLLFCKLAFYLNAPAYPIWYLIFSRRVRKCLTRLCENTLIRMNMRK